MKPGSAEPDDAIGTEDGSLADFDPAPGALYFETSDLRADLKVRAVRGGAITAIAQGARLSIWVGSTAVLARLLRPEDFGLLAMVAVFTGFLGLFRDLGLSAATLQRATVDHQQISTLFWINAAFGGILALAMLAIAPGVSWFYAEPRLTEITAVLSLSFVLGGLAAQHAALLRRRMRFGALAFIEIAAGIAGFGTAMALASMGAGYWSLVAMPLASGAATTLLVWLFCWWRPGPPSWGPGTRSMLVFGGNLTGFRFFNYFARNADNALIGWYWGVSALGFYSKAYGLLMFPLRQVNAPAERVAVPLLSRLQDEPERYRKTYLRIVEKIALLTMPLLTLLIVTGDWIVAVMLGAQWQQAVPVLVLLGLAGLLQPVGNTTGWLFQTQDRTREMLRWGLWSGAWTLTSFGVGLPWGPVGVAAAYAASSAVRTPLLFWYVGRSGPVRTRDFYRVLSLPSLISASIAGVLLLCRSTLAAPSPVSGLGLAGLAAVGISGAMLLGLPSGRRAIADFRDLMQGALRHG